MLTIIDPATGHSNTFATGIYIARGDDTLGPYNSTEAAALVVSGYLRANDHAARDGDAAWVPLAEFLPSGFPPCVNPPPAQEPVAAREAHPHRWRRLTAAFAVLLAVPLMVVGGIRWREGRHAVAPAAVSLPPPIPKPAVAVPSPSLPVAEETRPVPQPPAPAQPAGPLRGSVSLTLPGGNQTACAGVRVTAYPLAALESSLAPAMAAAQAARERLDPQIDTAAKERSARATDEQAALQAWRESAPADPMFPSLRFAYTGAQTATRTAEDNYRYLLDERTAAAGGEIYLRDLPAPAVAAETDAGGNFTLDLPMDDAPYAVVAYVRTTTDVGTVQGRYWFVKLSSGQRSGREPLRLDGGNLSSSTVAESLVHTAD